MLAEHYWINAQLAGNIWPLAVADFYLHHLVIHPLDEEGDKIEAEEDVQDKTLEGDEDCQENEDGDILTAESFYSVFVYMSNLTSSPYIFRVPLYYLSIHQYSLMMLSWCLTRIFARNNPLPLT